MRAETVGSFLLGAVAGMAAGHFLLPALRAQRRETEIKLDWNAVTGKFTSRTRDQRLRARKHDEVVWSVREDHHHPLPADADVEIRFRDDRSPLDARRPKGHGNAKGRVTTHEPDVYTYAVWYVSPEAQYCMEDPDLEILP